MKTEKQTIYIATPDSAKTLKIVNIHTGAVVGNVRLNGELVGTPIVLGNIVSVIVKDRQNKMIGATYRLPSGSPISQYTL